MNKNMLKETLRTCKQTILCFTQREFAFRQFSANQEITMRYVLHNECDKICIDLKLEMKRRPPRKY